MNSSTFRELCEVAAAKPSVVKTSAQEAYKEIQEVCKNKKWDIRKDCIPLKKAIIFDHFNHGFSLEPCLSIFSFIWDASNFELDDDPGLIHNDNDWLEIITISLSAKDSSTFFSPHNDNLNGNEQLIDFSVACKRLSLRGVRFEHINDDFYIHEESFQLIRHIIESYMADIGGSNCLALTFQILNGIFDSSQVRYLFHRRTSMGLDRVEPELPWGYVVALGAKYSHIQGSKNLQIVSEKFKELVEFLRDVIASFEIQPYTVWESIHVRPEKITEFLKNNVLYDNLISFFQFKNDYALEILDFISSNHDEMDKISFGTSLTNVFRIAKSLIHLSSPNSIKEISLVDIKDRSSVSARKVLLCIDNVFMNKMAKGLSFPPSSEEIDHVLTPLMRINNKIISLPSSISSLATLNAAIKQISHPDGKFRNPTDSKIGTYLELFLINRFSKSNIKVYFGDYKSKDGLINGDCDLFITSPRYNYIFELKKKSLTRKAMSGEDLSLISDLADSVMRSQSQCAKIEYVLLNDNELKLKNSISEHNIVYNGKPVQKISVSLHDFGALQDSNVFTTILRLAVMTSFASLDPDIDAKLNKWRQYLSTFKYYNELTKKYRSKNIPAFVDHAFMSIPQLMTILDECDSIESFDKEYGLFKQITYSTRDFYKEYEVKRNLRDV